MVNWASASLAADCSPWAVTSAACASDSWGATRASRERWAASAATLGACALLAPMKVTLTMLLDALTVVALRLGTSWADVRPVCFDSWSMIGLEVSTSL